MRVVVEISGELENAVKEWAEAHRDVRLDDIALDAVESRVMAWYRINAVMDNPDHPEHAVTSALQSIVKGTPGGADAVKRGFKSVVDEGYEAFRRGRSQETVS